MPLEELAQVHVRRTKKIIFERNFGNKFGQALEARNGRQPRVQGKALCSALEEKNVEEAKNVVEFVTMCAQLFPKATVLNIVASFLRNKREELLSR